MSDVTESQADLRISWFLQFLQTIHKKFRKNNEIVDQTNL
jgi:hypothetical protein